MLTRRMYSPLPMRACATFDRTGATCDVGRYVATRGDRGLSLSQEWSVLRPGLLVQGRTLETPIETRLKLDLGGNMSTGGSSPFIHVGTVSLIGSKA